MPEATKYQLAVRNVTSNQWVHDGLELTETSKTLENLTVGDDYVWNVIAGNSAGWGSWSDAPVWSFTVVEATEEEAILRLTEVSAPLTSYFLGDTVSFELSASGKNLKQIDVDWNDSSDIEVEGRLTTTGATQEFNRVFNQLGSYTISATAYSHDEVTSEMLTFSFDIIKPNNEYETELKTCSSVDENDAYECLVEADNFNFNDDIYSWVQFNNLEQGEYKIKWVFSNGDLTQIIEDEIKKDFDGGFYNQVTSFERRDLGEWNVEIFLDEESVGEVKFIVVDENQPPDLISSKVSPSRFLLGENITFQNVWGDLDSKYVALADARYRILGSDDWTVIPLQRTGQGDGAPGDFFEQSITPLFAGVYEVEFRASDGNWGLIGSTSEFQGRTLFTVVNDVEELQSAHLLEFEPTHVEVGVAAVVTIVGGELDSDSILANIEGTIGHCGDVQGDENQITMRCTPDVIGSKRFYVKNSSDRTEVISGSENWFIEVMPSLTNNKPTLRWDSYCLLYTSPSPRDA